MDCSSVQERFAQVVARTPDAIAVSSPAEGEVLTYAELDERANRIARRLIGISWTRKPSRRWLRVSPAT